MHIIMALTNFRPLSFLRSPMHHLLQFQDILLYFQALCAQEEVEQPLNSSLNNRGQTTINVSSLLSIADIKVKRLLSHHVTIRLLHVQPITTTSQSSSLTSSFALLPPSHNSGVYDFCTAPVQKIKSPG